jgi:hypothetical protein
VDAGFASGSRVAPIEASEATVEKNTSLDRTVDRLAFAPESDRPKPDEAREARLQAQLRRIRADPRWRPEPNRRGRRGAA